MSEHARHIQTSDLATRKHQKLILNQKRGRRTILSKNGAVYIRSQTVHEGLDGNGLYVRRSAFVSIICNQLEVVSASCSQLNLQEMTNMENPKYWKYWIGS